MQNAYFVLIGGGRLTQSLIQLREELGLQQRVHFIPTVALSELPKYTASADIGVQPIENTCLKSLHYRLQQTIRILDRWFACCSD